MSDANGRPVVLAMVLAGGSGGGKPVEGIISLGERSLVVPDGDAGQPGRDGSSGEVRIAVG